MMFKNKIAFFLVLLANTVCAQHYTLTQEFSDYRQSPVIPYFDAPRGMDIDPTTQDIYVADMFGTAVFKFKKDGTFVKKWGRIGNEDGEFMNMPQDVQVDLNGNVFVSDGFRIQEFTSEGFFVRKINIGAEFFARDLGGNFYVSNTAYFRIEKYSSDGVFLLQWGSNGTGNGQFGSPADITVASDGYVYVTDKSNNNVQKFSQSGSFVSRWGSTGTLPGFLSGPVGIEVDDAGIVYVSEYYNHRIQKFTNSGTSIQIYGSNGTGDGQVQYPYGIALNNEGHLLVSEEWGKRIHKFANNGNFISKWGMTSAAMVLRSPHGVVVDQGNVFAVDAAVGLHRYNAQGTLTLMVEGDWGQANYLSSTKGIALSADKDILILKEHAVLKYSQQGVYLNTWGSQGVEDGKFGSAADIAVAPNGNIYITDAGKYNIQIYGPTGNFISQWGSQGTLDGQFGTLDKLAIDNNGFVYVCDNSNSRIQKFTGSGVFVTSWASTNCAGIAIDKNGFVLVSEGILGIRKYTADGVNVAAFGSSLLYNPNSIFVDESNEVYVSKGILGSSGILKFHEESRNYAIHYVDLQATGANNGSSWSNAFNNLQTAIHSAENDDQIWVREGIYKPGDGTNRLVSYTISGKNISVYGGFVGTETALSQRDTNRYSVISGDINVQGDSSDNIINLFIADHVSGPIVIEGIEFRDATGGEFGPLAIKRSDSVLINRCKFINNNFSRASISVLDTSTVDIERIIFSKSNYRRILVSKRSKANISNMVFNGVNNTNESFSQIFSEYNSSLTIKNCEVLNLSGTFVGMEDQSGPDTSLIIKHCNFHDCTDLNASYLVRASNKLLVEDCMFSNIRSYDRILHHDNATSTVILNRNTFRENKNTRAYILIASKAIVHDIKISKDSTSFTHNEILSADTLILDKLVVEERVGGASEDVKMVFDIKKHVSFRDVLMVGNKNFLLYTVGNFTLGTFQHYEVKNNTTINAPCVFINGDSASISASIFSNNKNGGALRFSGQNARVSNCKFVENSTNDLGGALFCAGNIIRIDSCVFSKNQTAESAIPTRGGSIFVAGQNTIVSNSVFSENSSMHGGAIYNALNLTSINNKFINNTTRTTLSEGGAIFSGPPLQSYGDIFNGNMSEKGSALALHAGATIVNASIVRNANTAIWRDVNGQEGTISIVNSILHQNRIPSHVLKPTDTAAYSILQDTIPGSNNLYVNPGLNLNFTLKDNSPALDAGMPDISGFPLLAITDVLGNPRVQNGRINIGAVESIDTIESNLISGKIFRNINDNCLQDDADESPMQSILIVDPGHYFASSDHDGNYSAEVDTGTYVIKQIIPIKHQELITPFCPADSVHEISFNSYSLVEADRDFANTVQECTRLNVTVGSTRTVRCFRSNIRISYCNEGITEANNVVLSVELPPFLIPLQSTLPWTAQLGDTLIWNLGTVPAGVCNTIVIQDSVACEAEALNATQCVKATISPKSYCETIDPEWDRSSLSVEGVCVDSVVYFKIRNVGEANMQDSTSYRILFDNVLGYESKVLLQQGDTLTVEVNAEGKTIRLEADQPALHPGESHPQSTIESCGMSGNFIPTIRVGLPLQMPLDNGNVFEQTFCDLITGSYDPNDKMVMPSGVDQHYIRPEVELEYRIRFQNTGSDTAYNVVVVDTLSENLDIAGLEMGLSSHPYTWTISGKGNPVITWTFNNIMLPDSGTNQEGSNGFVNFKITQSTQNTIGTSIRNKAAIYFDFNEPVITNETQVTVWENFPVDFNNSVNVMVNSINKKQTSTLKSLVVPNPSSGMFRISVENSTDQKKHIQIYDQFGKMAYSANFVEASHDLYLENFVSGIYYYKILTDSGGTGSGKLIITK